MAFCTTCGTETETGKYCTNCGALAGGQNGPLSNSPTVAAPAGATFGAANVARPSAAPVYGQQNSNSASNSKTNVLAIVSLVTSLLGIFTAGFTCFAGVVFGHISLVQIKNKRESGRGLALAGLIIGYIGVAICILFLIGLTYLFSHGFSEGTTTV